MNARRLAGILFASTASVCAQPAATSPTPTPPIGQGAVWTPPGDFLTKCHTACDRYSGTKFGQCFVAQMQKAGAPPEAVSFARRTGDQGFLRWFRELGPVDVAYAEYPFRANENRVSVLVNGEPPWVDVDDLSHLDRPALVANREYADIARSYPNVGIFPSGRVVTTEPRALRLKSGGQRFGVDYVLRDGCQACKIVGLVQLKFDFDAQGSFLGVRVERVRARYS